MHEILRKVFSLIRPQRYLLSTTTMTVVGNERIAVDDADDEGRSSSNHSTSNVSSILDLSDDLIKFILREFVGWPGHFYFVSLTCKRFYQAYGQQPQRRRRRGQINDDDSDNEDNKVNSIVSEQRALEEEGRRSNDDNNNNNNTKSITTFASIAESIGRCQIYLASDDPGPADGGYYNPLRSITEAAALQGNLDVLQFMMDGPAAGNENVLWNILVTRNAAENGHLHIIQYARNLGFRWESGTCAHAALNGHLTVCLLYF